MTLLAGSLLVGCAANPANDKPQATVNSASPSASQTAETKAGSAYKIDETNSKVGFVGSKVTGSHDCSFAKFSGSINLVENEPTRSSVSVTIDMNSVQTEDEDLTDHLKSKDFFETEKYPESSFKSTMIAKTDKGYNMTGDLTLHGVTNSITFPATITVAPDSVTAKAEFSIKRFDWKIMYPGKADNLIRDEVLIKLDLKGTPESGAASAEPSPAASGSEPGPAASGMEPSPDPGLTEPDDNASEPSSSASPDDVKAQ